MTTNEISFEKEEEKKRPFRKEKEKTNSLIYFFFANGHYLYYKLQKTS